MAVPIWSHVTNLSLLQGAQAADQSQASLLSLPLFILHSLPLSTFLKHMHLQHALSRLRASVFAVKEWEKPYAVTATPCCSPSAGS